MTHVVLSLGSNIEREKNIRFALKELETQYGRLDVSPVYETSAVGFDGPAFYNLIAGLNSKQQLPDIVESLRNIESRAGRVRGAKSFDSRVLDIDVVLYGDRNMRGEGYNIPRDEIEKYAYVLKPLADIYPDLIHPVLGASIASMWREFEMKEQTVFIAEFTIRF